MNSTNTDSKSWTNSNKTTSLNICGFAIVCLSTLLTFFASSGKTQEALNKRAVLTKLSEVYSNAERANMNDSEWATLYEKIERINRVILGVGQGSGAPDQERGQLICVSRDNDNNNPYQLAYRGSDFIVNKLSRMILPKNECETAITHSRNMRGQFATCVSRDADSQNPYGIAFYDVRTKKLTQGEGVGSFDICLKTLDGAIFTGRSIAFCTSRDRDGQGPYDRKVYDSESNSIRSGGESFRSIDECLQAR